MLVIPVSTSTDATPSYAANALTRIVPVRTPPEPPWPAATTTRRAQAGRRQCGRPVCHWAGGVRGGGGLRSGGTGSSSLSDRQDAAAVLEEQCRRKKHEARAERQARVDQSPRGSARLPSPTVDHEPGAGPRSRAAVCELALARATTRATNTRGRARPPFPLMRARRFPAGPGLDARRDQQGGHSRPGQRGRLA